MDKALHDWGSKRAVTSIKAGITVTESDGIAYAILGALEIAVLRRLGEQRYELLGEVPQFYQRLFPGTMGTPCTTPWRHSEMLDYFVEDAERFFPVTHRAF